MSLCIQKKKIKSKKLFLRNCRFVILCTLGMSNHVHPPKDSINLQKALCLSNPPSLHRNINSNMIFHFNLFLKKINDRIFHKMRKITFWGNFWSFLSKIGPNKIFTKNIELPPFLPVIKSYGHSKNH